MPVWLESWASIRYPCCQQQSALGGIACIAVVRSYDKMVVVVLT